MILIISPIRPENSLKHLAILYWTQAQYFTARMEIDWRGCTALISGVRPLLQVHKIWSTSKRPMSLPFRSDSHSNGATDDWVIVCHLHQTEGAVGDEILMTNSMWIPIRGKKLSPRSIPRGTLDDDALRLSKQIKYNPGYVLRSGLLYGGEFKLR